MKVSVYDAKTQLSRLIDKANAGEEVVITRHGRPVARLSGFEKKLARRKLGGLEGKIWMSDDFDDPLPDEILDAFEGPIEPSC